MENVSNDIMKDYKKSNDIVSDMQEIINASQKQALQMVNIALIRRNWLIGCRIAEEELNGRERAEYGLNIMKHLSKELTKIYGKGFTKTNLYSFYSFYKCFPQIFQTVSGKLDEMLSWSHYAVLTKVKDEKARRWYEKKAYEQTWSVRTLQRNIDSQYYFRLLASQNPLPVKEEMKKITAPYQADKLEFIKNPVVAEFLGFSAQESFTETQLESSIISNLQKFLMELGKGYAFVARQQHIRTEKEDYFIDLVFYNYILKCFVLIDLKVGDLTHQDLGQMQMYVHYYERELMNEGDNPPIGIILCADKSESVVKYTLPENETQIFASKYKLYLPSEEELLRELNQQYQALEAGKVGEENSGNMKEE